MISVEPKVDERVLVFEWAITDSCVSMKERGKNTELNQKKHKTT